MVDWDDFDYDDPVLEGEADAYEVSAQRVLEEFFEANSSGVFFGNQLAVQNEDTFFHWITYRAIREWAETEHNLDFIFERDGRAYGVEVKNTLSYMDRKEFEIKIRLCETLGITPVFAVRMLPKTWAYELISRGGYAMILKYQLYPWAHIELARRVARELSLPVDAPKALAEGTMNRFETWHEKKL